METNSKTAPIVQEKDQNQVTLDLMHRMRLTEMAAAFEESLTSTYAEAMTPDAFLSWLLAREWDYRSSAAIDRLIRGASFRYNAYPEEIDYTINRGLSQNQMERLLSLDFVRQGQRSTFGRFALQRTSLLPARRERARASLLRLWATMPARTA